MELTECLVPKKIMEIQGDESTGKTVLALKLANEIQASGGLVVYVDADFKLNIECCKEYIDLNNLYVYQSNNTEEIIATLKHLTGLNIVNAIVIDSIGALQGKNSTSKDVTKFLIELSLLIAKSNTVGIITNQYRFFNDKLTPMYDSIINMYASTRVKTEVINEEYIETIFKNKLKRYGIPLSL